MRPTARNLLVLLTAILLVITGCTNEEKASGEKGENGEKSGVEAKKDTKSESPKQVEKEINDLVLKNTKMVKIFNISKRMNEKNPELGPFHVVRGIDARGQKSEIWIKDMKIHEIINSNPTSTTQKTEQTDEKDSN
jgi:hypothetical protein